MEIEYSLTELDQVSKIILDHWEVPVLLFNAPMGAGKTTLIKALCETIGVRDSVSSPTFSLVNTYKTLQDQLLFHFDFYRLNSIDEAFDIGIEEYLDSGHRCLIEWPDMIRTLLPASVNEIKIEILGQESRKLTLDK